MSMTTKQIEKYVYLQREEKGGFWTFNNFLDCCFFQCDTETKHLNKYWNPKAHSNEHHC